MHHALDGGALCDLNGRMVAVLQVGRTAFEVQEMPLRSIEDPPILIVSVGHFDELGKDLAQLFGEPYGIKALLISCHDAFFTIPALGLLHLLIPHVHYHGVMYDQRITVMDMVDGIIACAQVSDVSVAVTQ